MTVLLYHLSFLGPALAILVINLRRKDVADRLSFKKAHYLAWVAFTLLFEIWYFGTKNMSTVGWLVCIGTYYLVSLMIMERSELLQAEGESST